MMTLPTDGATTTAGRLPAALLADGLGPGGRDARVQEVKVATWSVGPHDESLDATRAFVRRTLHSWHIEGLTDDLLLVVTELVTNALRHGVSARGTGTTSVDVELYGTDRRLMCAVSDPSDEVPVRMTPDIARSSGRGLQIVEALSMYWGWTALQRDDDGSRGKSVWAVFTLDGVRPEPARAG